MPRTIPGFDVDGRFVLTSDEVLALDRLPASAVVIGGGAIGCEFASMMSDLGVQVTVLEALPKILPGCDADVVDVVVRSFKKRGIDVRTGVKVEGHEPGDGQTTVTLRRRRVGHRRRGRRVGRAAARCRDGLGLDGTEVEVDERGFVTVDEHHAHRRGRRLRRRRPGGHARSWPTSGFAEAIVAVKDILGEDPVPVDYGKVPVVHLLPPRGRLRRACPSRRPGTRASTSSSPSTASPATAGP